MLVSQQIVSPITWRYEATHRLNGVAAEWYSCGHGCTFAGRGARTDLMDGTAPAGTRRRLARGARRAAARTVLAANTANGKATDPRIVATANQHEPPV
jgi:hypothetical protein